MNMESIMNISTIGKTSKNSGLFKAASIFTLIAFIFTSVLGDVFVQVANAQSSIFSSIAETKDLNSNEFYIPETLGTIDINTGSRGPGPGFRETMTIQKFPQESPGLHATYDIQHTSDSSRKTLIHIQDAHCNYDAQMKIAELIEYLNEKYEIKTINLEGGEGEYDLSVFTGMKNKDLRKKVTDHFVKKGILNGTEYYAANNPDKIKLWGVENTDLYLKNLNVYREYVRHKDEITESLEELKINLNRLKLNIFPKDLIDLDKHYAGYKSGVITLDEYIGLLIGKSGKLSVNAEKYEHLYGLYRSFCLSEKIDFKKANVERAQLIDILEKMLSRNEVERLVKKTVDYKKNSISEQEFHEYILDRAHFVNIDLNYFSEIKRYIEYLKVYRQVDKAELISELNSFEKAIKGKLFENDKQRTLDELSRNLVIIKSLFDLTLTREDYRYYYRNSGSFDMDKYGSFIAHNAFEDEGVAGSMEGLNVYITKMSKFYEYSFQRDEAFVENLRFSTGFGVRGSAFAEATADEPGAGKEKRDELVTSDRRLATIIIAGGFHKENLARLCEAKGINFISICPNFKNKEGYRALYQTLISGQEWKINERSSISDKALAYYSYSCKKSASVHGSDILSISDWIGQVVEDIKNGVNISNRELSKNIKYEVIEKKFNKRFFRKYVYQKEFAIADLDVPLYTSKLKSCVALIVIDKKSKLHYLSHYDGTESKEDIVSSLKFESIDGRTLDIKSDDTQIYVVKGLRYSDIQKVVFEALSDLGVNDGRIINARIQSMFSESVGYDGTEIVSFEGELYQSGAFSFRNLNVLTLFLGVPIGLSVLSVKLMNWPTSLGFIVGWLSICAVFVLNTISPHLDMIETYKYGRKIRKIDWLKEDKRESRKNAIRKRIEFSNKDVFSAENNLKGTKLWDRFTDKNGGEEPVIIELTGNFKEIEEQYALKRKELLEKGYDPDDLVCFSIHTNYPNKRDLIHHCIVVTSFSAFSEEDAAFEYVDGSLKMTHSFAKFAWRLIEDRRIKNIHRQWVFNSLKRKGLMGELFMKAQKNVSERFVGWTVSSNANSKEARSIMGTVSDISNQLESLFLKRIWYSIRAYWRIKKYEKISYFRDMPNLKMGKILPWDEVKLNISKRKILSYRSVNEEEPVIINDLYSRFSIFAKRIYGSDTQKCNEFAAKLTRVLLYGKESHLLNTGTNGGYSEIKLLLLDDLASSMTADALREGYKRTEELEGLVFKDKKVFIAHNDVFLSKDRLNKEKRVTGKRFSLMPALAVYENWFMISHMSVPLITNRLFSCCGFIVVDRKNKLQYLAHISDRIANEEIKNSLEYSSEDGRKLDLQGEDTEFYIVRGTEPSVTPKCIYETLLDLGVSKEKIHSVKSVENSSMPAGSIMVHNGKLLAPRKKEFKRLVLISLISGSFFTPIITIPGILLFFAYHFIPIKRLGDILISITKIFAKPYSRIRNKIYGKKIIVNTELSGFENQAKKTELEKAEQDKRLDFRKAIKITEKFSSRKNPKVVRESWTEWYEITDIRTPLMTENLFTCCAVIVVDRKNKLHYMGYYNGRKIKKDDFLKSLVYKKNRRRKLDIYDKDAKFYIVKGSTKFTRDPQTIYVALLEIGIARENIIPVEVVYGKDSDHKAVVTHKGRLYVPDGVDVFFGEAAPEAVETVLEKVYKNGYTGVLMWNPADPGWTQEATKGIYKRYLKWFENFMKTKQGINHPFRFPHYIWAGDETHKGFKDYLSEYDENLYKKVKENGLSWTDENGGLHWIDEELEENDSEKIWNFAMEAINQYKKNGCKLKNGDEVKNVIIFHENIHKAFRDKKYKMLISHFKKRLAREVFNETENFGKFISAFRETYGKPHFKESIFKRKTNWYLEEFLVLCIQERFLFQDKEKVLDAIITNKNIDGASSRLILKNKRAIQGLVSEIIDSAVKLDIDGIEKSFKDGTIEEDFDRVEEELVYMRIQEAEKFAGLYRHNKGLLGLSIINKYIDTFSEVERSLNEKRVGWCPTFFFKNKADDILEDDPTEYPGHVFELNLRDLDYMTLSEFVDKNGMTTELREKVNIAIEEALRADDKKWVVHGHLHLNNIMVKSRNDGGIEDVLLIDVSQLSRMLVLRKDEISSFFNDEGILKIEKRVFNDLFMEGFNLENAEFKDSKFYECKFDWSKLKGATFSNCLLDSLSFIGVDLRGVEFKDCEFDSRYDRPRFGYSDLSGASFVNIKSRHTVLGLFYNCKLYNTRFDFMKDPYTGLDISELFEREGFYVERLEEEGYFLVTSPGYKDEIIKSKNEEDDFVERIFKDPSFQKGSAKVMGFTVLTEKEHGFIVPPSGETEDLANFFLYGYYLRAGYSYIDIDAIQKGSLCVHMHSLYSNALPSYADIEFHRRKDIKSLIMSGDHAILIKNVPKSINEKEYSTLKTNKDFIDFLRRANIAFEVFRIKKSEGKCLFDKVEEEEEIYSLLEIDSYSISREDKIYAYNRVLAQQMDDVSIDELFNSKLYDIRNMPLFVEKQVLEMLNNLRSLLETRDFENIFLKTKTFKWVNSNVEETGCHFMELLAMCDAYSEIDRSNLRSMINGFSLFEKALQIRNEYYELLGIEKYIFSNKNSFYYENKFGEMGFNSRLEELVRQQQKDLDGDLKVFYDYISDYLEIKRDNGEEETLLSSSVNGKTDFVEKLFSDISSQEEASELLDNSDEKENELFMERERDICNAFKGVNGRSNTVWTVVGIPSGLKLRQRQKLIFDVGRALTKNGYGEKFDIRQVIFFDIDPKSGEQTRRSFNETMEITQHLMQESQKKKRLPKNSKIIVFAPEMKNCQLASEVMELYGKDVKVIPDAYTDLMYPDVLVRVVLARHIAFYYNGNSDYKGEYLKHINRILSQISFLDKEITDLEKWRKNNVLRVRAIDYQDIIKWIQKQKQFAKSA